MNNRGVSGAIMVVLMILLVLVSVGIIWAVVANVLEQSGSNVDFTAKCAMVQVSVVDISQNNYITFSVTGGSIDGITFTFPGYPTREVETGPYSGTTRLGGIWDIKPSTTEVTLNPYFEKANGDRHYCKEITWINPNPGSSGS